MVVSEKEKSATKEIMNDGVETNNKTVNKKMMKDLGSSDKTIHCMCGTGCVDCYGKVNCGCPDCFTPEIKPRKKKKLKTKQAQLIEITFDSVSPIDHLIYENCTLTHHEEVAKTKVNKTVTKVHEAVEVVKRNSYSNYHFKRRPASCVETPKLKFSSHRMSLPDMDLNMKLEKPKRREKLRDPMIIKEVGPPKQTKYFCKKCKADVCNDCVTNECSSHNVQFIGTSRFHCQSPFHKIQHQHLDN